VPTRTRRVVTNLTEFEAEQLERLAHAADRSVAGEIRRAIHLHLTDKKSPLPLVATGSEAANRAATRRHVER
jgi:hypothetical protein